MNDRERWVAVIGNPNTGKTTLFNALTGGRARVGNYPGVTVDKRVGRMRTGGDDVVRLLDLPGTYSLAARTQDEMVAVDALLGHLDDTPKPEVVVVVVDAANIERNLFLVTQVAEVGAPTVVALNMTDGAKARGVEVDAAQLAEGLGLPVVATIASQGEGVARLREAILDALDRDPPALPWAFPIPLQEAEAEVWKACREAGVKDVADIEVRRALFDEGGEVEKRLLARGDASIGRALERGRHRIQAEGMRLADLEAGLRYEFIGDVASRSVRRPAEAPTTTSDRLDRVLTHRLWGTLTFGLVMVLVFMAIFTWAAPLMDFIDGTVFGGLAEAADGWAWLGDGAFKSLVIDGMIAGVGGVLVFLPQILILFLFLALLEGCGYMARGAFLMDRLMRRFGLSGRSFIPMLSSFACAIPGVMAARTIESRRDRIITMLVAPLMSCGARIPVYVLFTAAFVPATMLFGFLSLQGLVFAGMYVLGVVVAILVALVMRRVMPKSEVEGFLVELPPYRVPRPKVVFHRMWEQGWAFVARAGTVIFAASIVIWALLYFPRPEESRAEAAAPTVEAPSEAEVAGAAFAQSYLGRIGRGIEPVFAPMGWDWKVSAAVVASFPAREVVVSTLGIIYNLGDEEDEESEGLRRKLETATWDHGPRKGERVFDLAGALAIMVFFALCAQCVSTLATIWKETGTWRWALFSFLYMTALAWVGAAATAWIVRALF